MFYSDEEGAALATSNVFILVMQRPVANIPIIRQKSGFGNLVESSYITLNYRVNIIGRETLKGHVAMQGSPSGMNCILNSEPPFLV